LRNHLIDQTKKRRESLQNAVFLQEVSRCGQHECVGPQNDQFFANH
jgi:hypothetical protein